MEKVVGKEGISAKIIADSYSDSSRRRITSFELEYPRFIHSELMTHRLFTRNAASSRAVPILKKLKMVWSNPAMPVHWGKNQSGMQAKEELTGVRRYLARFGWRAASKIACASAYILYKAGVHKQIVNRITEPFERFKIVLTATEFENWYWLRNHTDAQPEIQELAYVMDIAHRQSAPQVLYDGEWHVPYIKTRRPGKDSPLEYIANGKEVSIEDALKISASCCAQVSYRTLNSSLKTALSIYDKLVTSEPVHASPFEHQAKPTKHFDSMSYVFNNENYEEGVTHLTLGRPLEDSNVWSGNFCGWIQHRQLIPNHVKM